MSSLSVNPLAFWALAALTVGCGIAVIACKKLFHSALMMVGSFLGVAGLYALLCCPFMAALQVLVYVGAIAMMLFFAIMLTEKMMTPPPGQHVTQPGIALLCSALLFIILGIAVHTSHFASTGSLVQAGGGQPTYVTPESIANISDLGVRLLNPYVFPFELVSILILSALIGAIVIARKEEKLPKEGAKD